MDIHIIDDSKLQLELVKAIAESSGLTAQGYSSAEEYLEYSTFENYIPPKLTIITDLRMPGKSGYELMTEIRKNRPEQRFVIITGTPNDKISDNERACFYLTKPVRLNKMLRIFETIEKCVECGYQPDTFKCEDLNDFNVDDWHCPRKEQIKIGHKLQENKVISANYSAG